MTLIEDLQWRGLLADCTDLDGLAKRLAEGPLTVYCGFDPTGDSLHVGHLMGQLTLARFQRAGNHVIALAGGATGMVGDPSGRSSERNLLTREQLDHNIACIKAQLSSLLDFTAAANPARLVDNADWIAPFSFLDFLRDVGKYFSLNVMLAKDSVKSRMEGDGGISYTEFSYQLLQAYDFYHLRKTLGCELQIGGSDQWGNLTAGTDLVRKKLGHETSAWGWTFPLITKSDGTKFGKTASGAVWLDATRTSPYKLYQFFVNTEDAKVCEYLRKFTFLSRAEIEPLEAAHAANPAKSTKPSPARSPASCTDKPHSTPHSKPPPFSSAPRSATPPKKFSATSSARFPPRKSPPHNSRRPASALPTHSSSPAFHSRKARPKKTSKAAACISTT